MNAELEMLVAKFPVPAEDGKLAGPNQQEMKQAVEQLMKLGGAAVVALVDALVDPSQGTDTQARHALHAMAVYVGGRADEQPRADVAQALASMLEGDHSQEAKGFVIRQLQVCGGKAAVDALGKALVDDNLCESAAQALLAIGGAANQFRQALPQTKSSAARLTILQALGVLRDAEAAAALRDAARIDDHDVRMAALWALANTGQAADVNLLIAASNDSGFDRIQVINACLLLAERLLAAGQKQPAMQIYKHLRDSRDESEAYVRQAAERGLAAAG